MRIKDPPTMTIETLVTRQYQKPRDQYLQVVLSVRSCSTWFAGMAT